MSYYLCAFVLVSSALLASLAVLEFVARDSRRPFPSKQKLLRDAGHSIRQKIDKLDRRLTWQILTAIILGMAPLIGLAGNEDFHEGGSLGIRSRVAFVMLTLVIAWALCVVISYARHRRNLTLGLLGERIVAEHLEPLKASGHRVFHDLPTDIRRARDGKSNVNIDHVVVGPSGVFAIETKTRRKGRTRVGFMAHEIIYDGRALAYPWGEDQHGLDQARRQAEWLAEFLQRELGSPVPVHALLVFPGWSIIRKDGGATNPVSVLSPRELPAAIERPPASGHTGFAVPPLDSAAIDLVSRQLESRCRDVEL